MAENDTQQELFNSKEGPLAKTGSNNRGWRDRYFRLKDGKLHYYKSEKDNTLLGYIDLRECTKVTKATGKKGNGFDIHVPGRVYNLSTRSENDTDEWIAAVDVSVAISKTVYSDSDRSGSIVGRNRFRSESFSSVDQEQGSIISHDSLNRKSEPDFHSLLEAEVKALNSKSLQLEEDLMSTQTHRDQLKGKILEMKTNHEQSLRESSEEISSLKNQIHSLEKVKSNLETINDSLRVQVQEREESMINLEHQLTEEIRELEEEARSLQEDLERLKERQIEVNDQNETLSQSNTELQGMLHKLQTDSVRERNRIETENTKLQKSITELRLELELEKNNHEKETVQKEQAEKQLESLKEASHKLELTERERDRLKTLLASLQQSLQSDSSSTTDDLKAERLQLQVELENIRSSSSRDITSVREACDREKREMMARMETLERDRKSLEEAKTSELGQVNELVSEVQAKIGTLQDNNHLLQIEKDKAMADLITLRKNMKEKERKTISDDENVSPSNTGSSSVSRDAKLLEAENRAELATRLLKEIQAERDLLKAQVKKQSPSKLHNLSNTAIVDTSRPPYALSQVPSDLKSKAPPTTAVSNTGNLPPPKPKRPTRDILDRLFF